MKYAIGIDLGGTTFKIGAFTENGEMLYKESYKTSALDNGSVLFDDMANAINIAVQSLKDRGYTDILKESVLLGIGLPGPVKQGTFIKKLTNIDVKNVDVNTEFGKRIKGINVSILNDANAAALGEKWMGAGRDHDNVCMITLGTGVGGGIVLGNKIVSGYHGAGGEIGHLHVIDNEEEICGCGGHGCLEQYASATGIVRVAKKMMEKAETENDSMLCSSKLFHEELDAKTICTLAKDGDKLSNKCLDYCMNILGKGLSLVAAVFDPELYILGGGVSESYEILIPRINKSMEAYSKIIDGKFKIVHASLGNDAGIYGAARYAFLKN